jgi:hypothetical protein
MFDQKVLHLDLYEELSCLREHLAQIRKIPEFPFNIDGHKLGLHVS